MIQQYGVSYAIDSRENISMKDFLDKSTEPHKIEKFDEGFYQAMIDTLIDGAFVVENKKFKLVNQALCELAGCNKSDLIGEFFTDYISLQESSIDLDDSFLESTITALNTELSDKHHSKAIESHLVFNHCSGSKIAVEISTQHFIDNHNNLYQVTNVRKKQAEQLLSRALRESESKIEQLIEFLPNIYFQSDNEGNISKISAYTERLLGYKKTELVGQPLKNLFISSEEYAQMLSRVMQNKGRETDFEASFCCKDKSSIRISMNAFANYINREHFEGIEAIAKGSAIRSTFSGKNDQAKIRDPLTKLLNQLAFCEHLSKSIRSARRHQSQLRVLYVNLQNLQEIAEIFGEQVGDICLVHFSRRLLSFFRETDTVARIGEENFAVLLDDYANDDALEILIDRLLEVMDKKADIKGYPYGFAINVGVANFPQDGINSSELVSHAESNMYRFKFSKNNLVVGQ